MTREFGVLVVIVLATCVGVSFGQGLSPMMLTRADVAQQAPGHSALEGGETCGSATVISSLPFADTGSTVGASDDYLGSCAWDTGAPDEVYAFTPTSDMAVNVSLCGSSFDTVLIAYEGSCSGADMACNDDACGFQSELTGLSLTAGVTYYFVVDACFGGDAGAYQIAVEEALPPPSCPSATVYSQPVSSPGGWSNAWTSEQTVGFLVQDNFSGATDSICGLRWWGLSAVLTGGWVPCMEPDDTFEIKFYQDAGGAPGSEVCSYTLTADKVNTGLLYGGFELYEYTAELPTCCTLASGWVSVLGLGDANCWFLWMDSQEGDGVMLQNGVGVPSDVGFCLLGADGDGDGVTDGNDDCPGTPAGDPVDADGCSTADDDGDGVLNDQDDCADTPACAVVDSDGCPLDGDDDGVADGCDDCPGTPAGDPVDADGCSTADDDGDGVLNDEDDCADTPDCAVVDSDGCALDGDDDEVADGCDDCPGTATGDPVDADGCSTADDDGDGVRNDQDDCADTPTCATNVDANGCAIDTDGDGNVDGCEPPGQTCCGGAGPVAPLGLAVGLLLLSRFGRQVRRRSR